ncbi:helix-turn-helix domain-containing protein [Arthrobacter sp. SDTb3-6]|uniref:helix-turn-helix domain-containing protein n=1 Tax=unclassified Arthrobacter TaxID=235627 RepID=UPI00159E91DC|nr:helix-turn-helix domain-containing protein [Arthrobacter sp. SDTb3-6]
MVLGANDVAKRLGVGPERVRELIHEGRLKAQKVGGQWVVDEGDVVDKIWNKSAGRPLSPKMPWPWRKRWRGRTRLV